jgi:hypothetical protein
MSLLAREYEGVTRVRDFENWTVKKSKQRKNTAITEHLDVQAVRE